MKPSPAQARFLKLMNDSGGVVCLTENNFGRISFHFRLMYGYTKEKRGTSIKTIEACINKKWLAIDVSIEKHTDYDEYYKISQAGIKALKDLTPQDYQSKKRNGATDTQITRELLIALAKRYNIEETNGEWIFFEELSVSTGFGGNGQRVDGWALNCWPSKNFISIAFEVKASRGDLLHELKHPHKRQQAIGLSNEFYFVTPMGLFKDEYEIPLDVGVMEVINGKVEIIKRSPFTNADPPTWGFMASVARRVKRKEDNK